MRLFRRSQKLAGETTAWHPIYEPGTPQRVRDEYERVCEERAHWQRLHARADSEAERYQFALEAIRDHGLTHEHPCHALHNGDCAEKMQEIARATLATQSIEDRERRDRIQLREGLGE